MSTRRPRGTTQSAATRGGAQAGFSLIELVLAIVIMAVGLAGLIGVMPLAVRSSADPMVVKQALTIAEGMLNEIAAKPFNNPASGFSGAATQANRALFDDVADYNGYAATGAYALEGSSPIVGLSGYNVAVAVTGSALGSGALQAPAAQSLLITVTVTYPGGGSISLSGYRFNYG
jgi:MSHA pilin protein MshD